MTPQEKAEIIKAAMPDVVMTAQATREINEVMYTLSEADEVPVHLNADGAMLIWRAVELVRDGKFTQEMRL